MEKVEAVKKQTDNKNERPKTQSNQTGGDDIFNLNSIKNEDYYVNSKKNARRSSSHSLKRDKRRKRSKTSSFSSRHSSYSSRSSDLSDYKRKNKHKKVRNQTPTSSSYSRSPSTSSSSSRTNKPKKYKLESKIILTSTSLIATNEFPNEANSQKEKRDNSEVKNSEKPSDHSSSSRRRRERSRSDRYRKNSRRRTSSYSSSNESRKSWTRSRNNKENYTSRTKSPSRGRYYPNSRHDNSSRGYRETSYRRPRSPDYDRYYGSYNKNEDSFNSRRYNYDDSSEAAYSSGYYQNADNINSYRYYNYDLPAQNYNYGYYERSYDEYNTNKSVHRSIRTPPLPPDEPTSIDNKSKSINDTELAPTIPAPLPPPPPPSIPYDSYSYNYYSYYNYAHPPLAPIASSSSLPNQQQGLVYPQSYPSSSVHLPAYQANCNSLPNPVDATSPPLNQYQEVTSTNTPSSNLADTFKRYSPSTKISSNETQSLKSSNKNELDLPSEQVKIKTEASSLDEQASLNELNKSNDDNDLVAFKNKIQIQLKEKLFNDSVGRMKQSSANSSRSVSSSSTNNSLIEEDGKSKDANREKRHHRHHHKHHKRHKHHRHKHHKHKKERHSKTDRKEKTKLDPPNEEDNSDDDDENDFDQERSHKKSLRRSDRIKVIETKKQHHKELVIAEKIKKHHTHNHDSNDGIENGTPRSDSEHCNDISLAANQSEDLDKMPAVKVKDRWRRFSEKELCENSDQLLNKSSTELVLTNLNSPCKAESTTFSPNKFDSPRAFKKMLLNKAACESLDSQQSSSSSHTNIISSNEYNVDFKELYSLYDHIDENLYLCKKKKTKFNKEAKRMVCDCSTSEQERQMGIVACGDDCLNRLLMIECGARCPCGEYCTNRNFKTKNNAKIQPFKTEMKGYGLKAVNDLKANTFLIEYIGEVIGLKEFKKRCEKYSEQNNEHFYFMSLHNDLFIDATKKGNISRFFNHSCDPNCETQKWTVNGELRIGFFTKRPVGVNEELSFDYQFQTVGKKQQKCYCGSEKCRGYLGVSSKDGASNSLSGALNHMWEQESDEEDDDDEDSNEDEEDDEENGENKESNDENVVEEVKTKNRSSSKRKSKHSTKSHGKHKRKSKDRKKRRSNKDFELNSQIKSIDSLSNKENVLKLCQLMYRTESLESRIDILNLLLNTKSEISLRLFMDYHGLKLLWSWMVDLDSINDSIAHLECKMKILKVLSMMSIKNRTTLEECKLLAIVKKWSETDNAAAAKAIENGLNESESDAELNESLSKKKLNDTEKWVRNEILKIADSVADKEGKHHHHQSKEISDAYKQLVEQASELVYEWSNLKQEFKIPKKQRDEERKEHERELNSTSDATRATSQPVSTTNSANTNENYSTEKNRDYKYRNRYFNKRHYYENHYNYNQGGYYNQFDYQNHNLTKEQRRQMFEQHIKEQEAAAAAAQATQEAERVATEATAGLAAQGQPKQELKLVFDNKTQQWIQCYVQQPFDQSYSYYNREENRMGPPQNSSIQINAINQADFLQPSSIMNRINITDSHLNDLKQAVQQFMPEVEQVKQTITEKLSAPSPASPILKNAKKNDSSLKSSTSRKSLSMISAKLPPDWKCKEMGKRILYYNTKTKKSQWQYPHAKSSSAKNKSSESQKKAKLDENSSKDKKSNDEAITSTSATIEPDQANNKECDKTTPVQSSVVVSDTASSEAFKICKDQFREKLSRLIVKVLQPFLKEDCKVGHIQNTDDFKHLARKFTHMIMEKEMSRATKIEELDLNKRIKMKTQEFITRYMQRFNGNYSRKTDDQN